MANSMNTFIMDRVRRITEINNTTGLVNWTARGVGKPNLNLTGENVEKSDSIGALIAKLDTAKGAEFSAEMDTIVFPLLASQRGAKLEIGSATKKVKGETFDILPVEGGKITLTYTPITAPAYVYPINTNDSQGEPIAIGVEDGDATIADNVITLPEGFTATRAGVLYEYETEDAEKLTDSSESFGDSAKYIIHMLARDICNPDLKRAGSLVFPKAKLDNNVSLDLTTEGTHPFSITALKDYCAEDGMLYYWIWATK